MHRISKVRIGKYQEIVCFSETVGLFSLLVYPKHVFLDPAQMEETAALRLDFFEFQKNIVKNLTGKGRGKCV